MVKIKCLRWKYLIFIQKLVCGILFGLLLRKVIIIFWNDVREPRIAVLDENHLRFGEVILGGGWIEKEFKDLTIN